MAKRKAARKRPQTEIIKHQTDDAKVIGATVTTSERGSNRYRRNESKELARRVQQMVLWCGMFNATNCAGEKMRLFRKSGARGTRAWKGVPVAGRKRLQYLTNPQRGYGPGYKAATYAMDSEGIEEVVDHPALDLLNNANPFQRGTTFDKSCWLQWEFFGRRYVHIVGPTVGEPTELYVMYADKVRTVADARTLIGGYMYGRDMSVEKFFPPDEVLQQVFCPHPFDPFASLSPLHAVFSEADLYAASNESELALWQNGARPDFGVKVSKDTTDIQMRQMREHVEQRHKGPKRRGEFFIFRDSDFVPLNFTQKEMEYLAGRQDLRTTIGAAYGVPETFWRMNDANLAGSQTAQEFYARFTKAPRLAQNAEEWTETLLPWYGINPGEYWFAYDDCVPENKSEIREDVKAFVSLRVITRNEGRQLLGFEPMDGLDEFEQTKPAPGDKPSEPDKDDKESKKALPVAGVEVKDDRLTTQQAEMEAVVRRWFLSIGNTFEVPETPGQVDLSGYIADLAGDMRKPIGSTLMRGVVDGSAEAGKITTDPLSLFPDHAVEFIDKYTLKLAKGVTKTTADNIKQVLKAGIANGDNYAKLSTAVREEMTAETQWRAPLIARTEYARAHNYGKVESWKRHGVPGARWKLSSGACPSCTAFVKKYGFDREIDEPFADQFATFTDDAGNEISLDYETVYAPPLHVNCRCYIQPIMDAADIHEHTQPAESDIGLEDENK